MQLQGAHISTSSACQPTTYIKQNKENEQQKLFKKNTQVGANHYTTSRKKNYSHDQIYTSARRNTCRICGIFYAKRSHCAKICAQSQIINRCWRADTHKGKLVFSHLQA
jgi:hypothetical protein